MQTYQLHLILLKFVSVFPLDILLGSFSVCLYILYLKYFLKYI